ncbi:MAG: SH3 domain-containing protein [Arenibacterium sp.]
MPRYIPLCFLLLAWVFYEMSGGSEFEPKVVAELAPVLEEMPVDVTPLEKARRARAEEALAIATARVREPAPAPVQAEPVAPAVEETSPSVVEERRAALRSTLPVFTSVTGAATEQLQTISLTGLGVTAQPQPAAPAAPAEAVRAPVAETADIREVVATRVNMRAGPGTSHDILARLSRGQSVEILGDNGQGWLRLRTLPEDRVGWIAERLISPAVN